MGGSFFAGGYAIVSPIGAIYSSNVTPSRVAGIGAYSERDFDRALREGLRADGAHLYPAMPYTAYVRLSDQDVHALYAYFMKGVAPVDTQPPKTNLPFPFSLRFSMALWNALFLKNERFTPDPSRDAEWNRGAYLVNALEHCSVCHSPRNFLMAERAGQAFAGGSVGSWYAPNITSDPISGIGGWSHEELAQYLKTGATYPKSQAAGGMAEAVTNSLQHLDQKDIEAIAKYVMTISPIRDRNETQTSTSHGAPTHFESAFRGAAASQGDTANGLALYSGYCASCHQPTGTGTPDHAYPALFQNTATGASRPDNLVSIILFGVNRDAGGRHVFMPQFGDQSYVQSLSDVQIAAISNYVLANFGDPKVHVTDHDVATARKGGPPSPLLTAATIFK